jgi:hypothetical protein
MRLYRNAAGLEMGTSVSYSHLNKEALPRLSRKTIVQGPTKTTQAGKRSFFAKAFPDKPGGVISSVDKQQVPKIKSLQVNIPEGLTIWCPGSELNPAHGISPPAQPANRIVPRDFKSFIPSFLTSSIFARY